MSYIVFDKMAWRLRLSVFSLSVLLWAMGPVLAADKVFLAVPLSMQPYFIAESSSGLAYESIEAAFAARGHQVFPVYISERDLDENILDKRPDIDCAGFKSARDSEEWFSVDDYFPFHDHAVSLAANNLQIDNIADLQDKSVIAYRGARKQLGAEFSALMAENLQYREIANHRAQVKLLLKHRVQVIIADKLLIEWYVRYLDLELEEPAELAYHDLFLPVHLRFACRQPGLLQDFRSGLEEISSKGELDKIFSRYNVGGPTPGR